MAVEMNGILIMDKIFAGKMIFYGAPVFAHIQKRAIFTRRSDAGAVSEQ